MTKETTTASSRVAAKRRVGDLTLFSRGLMIAAEKAPERLSLPQATFFMLAALADLRGGPTTYTDILETMGDSGQSVRASYGTFLAPSKRYAEALGWLEQEEDRDDRRRKYLKLTERGLLVINEILDAMED